MKGKKITHLVRETRDYGEVLSELNKVLIKYDLLEIEAFGVIEALKMDIYNSLLDEDEE